MRPGAEGNGGDINITAGSFQAQGGSLILADTRGVGNAGNITLNVEESISLDTGSVILTEVGEGAVGDAGNIDITANSLTIENGANITASTNGEGNAGNIIITTTDIVSLFNGAEIRSNVEVNATGNGGTISLASGELNLNDNSRIDSNTQGLGNAGNINISVFGGDINLDNSNQILSQTRVAGEANAGNITIETDGSLFSTAGNLILADSKAMGNGGNITITVGEKILLEGLPEGGFPSQIVAGLSSENAEGLGGDIEIQATEIVLDDLAFITSNTVTDSIGSAGNIAIDANSINLMNNSFINALTANDSDGGSITVNAQALELNSGGKILAATDSGGNAGNIDLNIIEQIIIDNNTIASAEFVDFGVGSQLLNDLQESPSGIYANATENSLGNGGNVNIGISSEQTLQNFIVSNGGQIIVNIEGTGSGGNIFLKSQSLTLDNNATISASTEFGQDGQIKGGQIKLEIADNLILKNNSLISAQALNDADGGNLTIDSRFIIAFPSNGNGNDIIANAEQGNGGEINITSTLLGIKKGSATEGNNSNDIDASSRFNQDGNVIINTPDNSLIQRTVELSTDIVVPEETAQQACEVNRETASKNNFVIKGKGGIPPAPELPLNSQNIGIAGKIDSTSIIPQAIETSQGKIQPARGIQVTESGEIILTAYPTSNSQDIIPQRLPSKRTCS